MLWQPGKKVSNARTDENHGALWTHRQAGSHCQTHAEPLYQQMPESELALQIAAVEQANELRNARGPGGLCSGDVTAVHEETTGQGKDCHQGEFCTPSPEPSPLNDGLVHYLCAFRSQKLAGLAHHPCSPCRQQSDHDGQCSLQEEESLRLLGHPIFVVALIEDGLKAEASDSQGLVAI